MSQAAKKDNTLRRLKWGLVYSAPVEITSGGSLHVSPRRQEQPWCWAPLRPQQQVSLHMVALPGIYLWNEWLEESPTETPPNLHGQPVLQEERWPLRG
jgi:hypothetical protein